MAKTANANSMFAGIKKENQSNLKNRKLDVVLKVEENVKTNEATITTTTKNNTVKEHNVMDASMQELQKESDNTDLAENTELSNVQSSRIYQIKPDKLIPFRDEKLRLDLHTGDSYERLKESISQNGVVNPAIVMQTDKEGVYEIIAGHNRVQICKELNIDVPCIVKKDLTIEEANKICIDTNLLNRQRSEFKPTQFAYMLMVRFEKEKHAGVSMDGELSGDKIGAQFSLDRRTIHRYIKLNQLTEKAKVSLDSGKITLRIAYELAFLPEILQDFIIENYDNYKINEGVVKHLKQQLKQQPISDEEELLKYVKFYLPQKTSAGRKFDYRNIKNYIPPSIPEDHIEEYVIKALQFYEQANS